MVCDTSSHHMNHLKSNRPHRKVGVKGRILSSLLAAPLEPPGNKENNHHIPHDDFCADHPASPPPPLPPSNMDDDVPKTPNHRVHHEKKDTPWKTTSPISTTSSSSSPLSFLQPSSPASPGSTTQDDGDDEKEPWESHRPSSHPDAAGLREGPSSRVLRPHGQPPPQSKGAPWPTPSHYHHHRGTPPPRFRFKKRHGWHPHINMKTTTTTTTSPGGGATTLRGDSGSPVATIMSQDREETPNTAWSEGDVTPGPTQKSRHDRLAARPRLCDDQTSKGSTGEMGEKANSVRAAPTWPRPQCSNPMAFTLLYKDGLEDGPIRWQPSQREEEEHVEEEGRDRPENEPMEDSRGPHLPRAGSWAAGGGFDPEDDLHHRHPTNELPDYYDADVELEPQENITFPTRPAEITRLGLKKSGAYRCASPLARPSLGSVPTGRPLPRELRPEGCSISPLPPGHSVQVARPRPTRPASGQIPLLPPRTATASWPWPASSPPPSSRSYPHQYIDGYPSPYPWPHHSSMPPPPPPYYPYSPFYPVPYPNRDDRGMEGRVHVPVR